jgi:hypothetical protein
VCDDIFMPQVVDIAFTFRHCPENPMSYSLTSRRAFSSKAAFGTAVESVGTVGANLFRTDATGYLKFAVIRNGIDFMCKSFEPPVGRCFKYGNAKFRICASCDACTEKFNGRKKSIREANCRSIFFTKSGIN